MLYVTDASLSKLKFACFKNYNDYETFFKKNVARITLYERSLVFISFNRKLSLLKTFITLVERPCFRITCCIKQNKGVLKRIFFL